MEQQVQNGTEYQKLEAFYSELLYCLKENDYDDLDKVKQMHREAFEELQKVFALAKKEKEEANKILAEANEAKKKAEENVNNMNENKLGSFKNNNNPSVNIYRIFKLMFLIFNPEENMPSDNISKELPNIKSKCLNMKPQDIKKKLINLLDDINWVTPQFLHKVNFFRQYPYTDANKMDSLAAGCKDILFYFHNLVKYKELYDKYNSLNEKSKVSKEKEEATMTRVEEIKKIIKSKIEKNKNSLKEFDDSKNTEKNKLLDKLTAAENILEQLDFK